MRALLFLSLLASAACLRKTEYHCTSSAQCDGMPGGYCEATTYCSFTDTACPSGRRYGEFGGELANTCVGGTNPNPDGGVIDGNGDGGGGGCPVGYVAIAGGGTHLYKKTTNAAIWDTQRTRCSADGSNVYLAIPNDAAELGGITTTSGDSLTWVGINDIVTETTYVTVLGAPATYLPWDTTNGEPDNSGPMPGQDCVSALMSSPLIETDRCSDSYAAICECEP